MFIPPLAGNGLSFQKILRLLLIRVIPEWGTAHVGGKLSVNVTRKLAAIVYADVAGYSRLTGADEEGTHKTLSVYLDTITASIENHGGQVLHYAGDAILAEFASVVTALTCAVDVQRDLAARNKDITEDRRVEFRIGVNMGDVIVDRNELYGNGVNIAARLESLADPGGICISGIVYDQVKSRLALDFDSQGAKTLKNIKDPVAVYKVRPSPAAGAEPGDSDSELTAPAPADDSAPPQWTSFASVFVVLVGIVMIVWAYYHS